MNLVSLFLTLGVVSLASCDTPQEDTKARVGPAVATTQPRAVTPPTPPAPAVAESRPLRSEADTLRLRNGSIVRLTPARATDFTSLTGIDADTTEQKYIRQAGSRARRSGSQLLLTLTNGRKLTLTNNITDPDEANHVIYRFRGTLAGSNFWVLDVTRWESGFVQLINKDTGRRTKLWGRPLLAPDGSHLVTSNSDMEAHYSPNGLQVWSLKDGVPMLRWNRVVNSWGPEEVRWLDNQTLIIKQYYPDSTPQTRYARLLLPQSSKP